MIDIGLNLTSRQFDADREAVLERALAAGVHQLILTGTDLAESAQAAELAARRPGRLFSTAGVHPHDARHWTAQSAACLRSLATQPQVVAIGECGLDFNRDFSPRPAQEAAFQAQLAIAADLNLPVFLHCRDAHERFVALLAPWLPQLRGAVLHCFTGSRTELEDCLALGLHIGITGWICDERRGQALRELVPLIPADRLMLETDAPYLLPRDLEPKPQSRRNEPCWLPHIAATVAGLRGEALPELILQTRATTQRFFALNEVTP